VANVWLLVAILCRFLQKRQGFAAYNLSIGGVWQSFRIKPAETCLFWLFLAKICRLSIRGLAKSGNQPAR
jgi:hypothetical protein